MHVADGGASLAALWILREALGSLTGLLCASGLLQRRFQGIKKGLRGTVSDREHSRMQNELESLERPRR